MMELMNRMSDKINWNEKVFDNEIATKWKSEALATPDTDISEKMVDWVGSVSPMPDIIFQSRLFILHLSFQSQPITRI